MAKKNIVYLSGGLGNQMFQYAFAKSLQTNYNVKFEINTTFYYRIFKDQTPREIGLNSFNLKFKDCRDNKLQRIILKIKEKLSNSILSINSTYYSENKVNHKNFNNLNLKKKNYFRGYWQNFKYFESIKNDLKKDFSLDHNLKHLDPNTFKKITETNSVCVHVRRKDYLGTDLDVVDVNYYRNAFNKLKFKSKSLDLDFFIFSDDINWCNENLTFLPNSKFCSFSMLNDFHLMSLCKHFIIPNSTFSWWAAYLSNNNNNKIIIIPTKWHKTNINLLKDASPSNWIILNNK